MGTLLNVLTSIAEQAPAGKDTKKKKYPIVKLDEKLSESLTKFNRFKKEEKEAKTNKEMEEQPIQEFVRAEQEKLALTGTYHGTFELVTNDGKCPCKFVASDKFTVTKDAEAIAQLKGALGERYGQLITEKTSVALKPEILESETLSNELMTLVGPENFARFFDVVTNRSTCDSFDEKMWSLGHDALEVVKRTVVQAKPAIK